MVIFVKNGLGDPSSNPGRSFFFSRHLYRWEKHASKYSLFIGEQIVGQSGFFNFVIAICLREGELNSNLLNSA